MLKIPLAIFFRNCNKYNLKTRKKIHFILSQVKYYYLKFFINHTL